MSPHRASGGRISVIIPAINEAEQLPRTLGRLERETEVILVDGGSSDGTRAVAEAAGVRVLESEAGRARQMNRGASAATGDTLVFLHADTELPPGWDSGVREAIEQGAVGGRFDVDLVGTRRFLAVIASAMNLRSRMSGISTGDQAQFVRRDVFEAMGGFPQADLMEDIALSRSLKRVGPIAALRLRVRTSARRWESRGILRTILLMWALRFAYFVGVPAERLARWYR